MKNILIWFPRVLVIAFALFISFFATDAFSTGGTIWQQIGNFLMHLIPTAVTLIILRIAWEHRMLGGMLCVLWGLFFTINFGKTHSTSLFLMFSMPLLLSGFMFIFSQLYAREQD